MLRRVLRRLLGAAENDKLKLAMEIEIEYEDFIEQQMNIAKKLKIDVEEKDKELEQERREKELACRKVLNSAGEMKKHGMAIDIIMQATGLSKEEIKKL